jgi:hypothetical protein
MYDKINKAYTKEYYVYSWPYDSYTSGAFALFGGGQFSKLYPLLTLLAADGKFHIVGEASSVHYAWVVGALDSATAAVHKFLRKFELKSSMQRLRAEWEDLEEVEAGLEGTVYLQVSFDQMQRELEG